MAHQHRHGSTLYDYIHNLLIFRELHQRDDVCAGAQVSTGGRTYVFPYGSGGRSQGRRSCSSRRQRAEELQVGDFLGRTSMDAVTERQATAGWMLPSSGVELVWVFCGGLLRAWAAGGVEGCRV